MQIIGIDLGTTNSLICVYRDGKTELIPNSLGEFMTRSVVSLLEDERVLVGSLASERLISHPEASVSSFKSYMGTEHEFKLGNKKMKAHELSALILKQLKNDAEAYLGEAIDEAIISVPAYFNDNQRSATKLAARLAGLSVTRLINEPSAAALYYHAQDLGDEKKYLVIDFGGGTLDVSVVDCFENIIEIIAIAGDNRLGGDDIDLAIVSHFLQSNSLSLPKLPAQKHASLIRKAKKAKEKIALENQVVIGCQLDNEYYSMVLTRELLREICNPILSRVKSVISRAFKQSKIAPAELSDVLLVGGSSKLITFVDFITEIFGNTPTVVANTDEIVAHGACMYAGIKERALTDIIMTDVCPFSLGVATYNSTQDQNPHMAVLIERSSLLPISHNQLFRTLANNQTLIRCEIFQGENYFARDNLHIGEISVNVPPGPAGKHFVRITFTYDIDGILHVAAESSGGQIINTVILNPQLSLSDSEVNKKLKQLDEIRLSSGGSDTDKLIIARLGRLFAEFISDKREYVQYLIAKFQMTLDSSDIIEIKKVRERLKNEILVLEEELYLDPLSDRDGPYDENDKEFSKNLSKRSKYPN